MTENLPPEVASRSPRSIKVACLRVGNEFYALDIMCIKEIIRQLPIVSVPKAPLYIDGVVNLRKAVIPVVDLRKRFGFTEESENVQKRRIVICAIDGRIVGLLADDLHGETRSLCPSGREGTHHRSRTPSTRQPP